MIFLIVLISIIGFVLNILFWVWVYHLIFGAVNSSAYKKGNGNYYNTGSELYNMVDYNNLMTFMSSLKQLEKQIQSQTTADYMDNDFRKFYKLIQKSSANAVGGKVKIDPSVKARFNEYYFKIMNQMRESDHLSKMKSDVFQSNLSSMAANAGIDFRSSYY